MAEIVNEDSAPGDSITWARTSVIHGLRKAPTSPYIQNRGYGAKSPELVFELPTFNGGVIAGIGGQENTASGEERLSAYGEETRTAFPYEGKRTPFDSKHQSVHVALENYGLNCPVSSPPSPMRSKSALGRDIILRMPRSKQSINHDGQVDSLFDHNVESFETLTEAEDRYLKSEDASASDPHTGVSCVVKSKRQNHLENVTKGALSVRRRPFDPCDNEGVAGSAPVEEFANADAREAEHLLEKLNLPARWPEGNTSRGIFCSRALSLRSITTIGFDMDYTLIHYNMKAWEGKAYSYGVAQLRKMGYPSDGLSFDPDLVIQGLIMDKEKGNLVKADRFGCVKRAMHGTKMMSNLAISNLYGRELVDLRNEQRWEFLNTLFSISEAGLYMQMVERLDEGVVPPELGSHDYESLHGVVAKALFKSHVEGKLKDEIISRPDLFVEPDPELPLALLDQREAGKRLLLITNSDYHYTNCMMQYAFNQYLPQGLHWRDLFDMVIVSSRKPEFFTLSHPLYEIVTEDGLMRPCFKARPGGLYSGGSAAMVEKALGIQGDETMYVGDHIYTDVNQSKVHLRWRTTLICRELEREVQALANGRQHRQKLIHLMKQKEFVADVFNQFQLAFQRRTSNLPAQTDAASNMDDGDISECMQKVIVLMGKLDQRIAPMLEADGQHFNPRWGYLSRAGLWDKSHLTRQIEKYADIYTSRVSNFLQYTPFMYFKSNTQIHSEEWFQCSSPNI